MIKGAILKGVNEMETIDIKRFISPNLQISEAYKTIRNNIHIYGSKMKIIGLTSCNPEKAKSIVSLNLARSMALVGKKVILIDADIYKAVLSRKVTNDHPKSGLYNYLVTDKKVEEIICRTDISNLHMILSGSAVQKSFEAPSKDKLKKLLKDLSESYDCVLVDTPPIDALDGTEVVKLCDGVIIVLKANTVDYKTGRKTKKVLDILECPILGAVLLQAS